MPSTSSRAEGPPHQSLGARLRLARRVAGLSQHELAVAIATSLAEIRQYEAGTLTISAPTMLQLAGALDVPLAWLYGLDDRDYWEPSGHDVLRDDPELAALVSAFGQLLDDESRRLVTTMASRLAASGRTVPPLGAMVPARPSVLVVDDAPDTLVLVGAFLRGAGYDMLGATAPDAALDILAGGADPVVLLTDYMMPGMTGLDLVSHAARLRPGLPAVVMTGFAANFLFAAPPPHIAVLAKPFGRAALLMAVETARAGAGG